MEPREDLTEDEKAILFNYGQCPDCGGDKFLRGPEGGLTQNIKCSECGSKFNICPPCHLAPSGIAERI